MDGVVTDLTQGTAYQLTLGKEAALVALEPGAVVGEGYLHAAVSEGVTPDSRAVRWREHSAAAGARSVVTLASGASRAVDNLSALGKTEFLRTRYICGYVELV